MLTNFASQSIRCVKIAAGRADSTGEMESSARSSCWWMPMLPCWPTAGHEALMVCSAAQTARLAAPASYAKTATWHSCPAKPASASKKESGSELNHRAEGDTEELGDRVF